MPGILPDMSIDEALDVTCIYAIADAWPYLAPHHTLSHAGLLGGRNWPHPRQISLAHRGVLFLDKLPESATCMPQLMRQVSQLDTTSPLMRS
jgi:magnesium chelatase family protein